MKLTQEQFERLVPYEKYFRTAINSKYASYPGISALETINRTYNEVTGIVRKLQASCGSCILNLLTDMGKIYFAHKQEQIDADNDKAAAEKTKRLSKKRTSKKNGNKKTTA